MRIQSTSAKSLPSWHKVCVSTSFVYFTVLTSLLFVDAVELGDFNPSTSLSLLMLPNLNIQLLSQISEVYSQLK